MDVDKVSSSYSSLDKIIFIYFTQQVMVLISMHQRELRKRMMGEQALARWHVEVEDFGAKTLD